jgi:AcrR family transcriptional regulator
MGARAEAVDRSRSRIIEAGKSLHAEQGILGTSYEEIAQRAGVAPATVYRHFPTLDDLLPACAGTIQVLRPVSPEYAAALFEGLPRPNQRLDVLVRGTCACYARDGGWLHAARHEGDLAPSLRDIRRIQAENLRLLVTSSLAGTETSERAIRAITALIDFPVWKAFRDAGFSEAEATLLVLQLVHDRLGKEHVSA